MVGRAPGRIRLNAGKTQFPQIQLLDERLNHPYRVVLRDVFRDVFIDTLRQQIPLVAAGP
jgi:hypothetical protein